MFDCFNTPTPKNTDCNKIVIIERGPRGPRGFTGPQGQTGATGPQGPQGATGPQGPQGPQGVQGPQGATGATGATGPQGPQGPQGVQGPQGATGATGATGPQGPAGENGLAAYGGMYSSAGTTVSLTTTPTPLTLATALPSKNVTDGTNQLTVTNAGDYEINYGLLGSINTASTVTLTVAANGTPVTSATTTGNYEADEEFNLAGSTIATLAAGDVITLLGSAGASVTLTPNGGTNAYVTVKQLNTPAP